MKKHKIKFNSEHDIRSQKSHYTNVSKTDSSSKNVELSLEVELDDEVRSIIKNPEKCPSALLDVTVIKPKGLDEYTTKTQTLKTDQVKQLIESMRLDQDDKKMLMEKLFGLNNVSDKEKKRQEKPKVATKRSRKKSCLSSRSKIFFEEAQKALEHGDIERVTDGNHTTIYSVHNQKPHVKNAAGRKIQQVYTTPRTYENIRSMFACKYKDNQCNENNKMDQPCLCQNCAIVGILTDSQKRPFATEPMPDPMERRESRFRRPSRKKSVTFKHFEDLAAANRSHDQCQAIFKILSIRIAELEKRILIQEDKAVPKDYFKKVITKLVNHLSKLTHYTTEERTVMNPQRQRDPMPSTNKYKSSDKYNRYYVNPVLLDNTYKIPAEKEYDPKPCSSSEPPRSPTDSLWKWGEDFLSTGRDLKNKVVVLLEETLQHLKRGWERPHSNQGHNDDIETIVDELSKNLARTVKMNSPRSRNEKANLERQEKSIPSANVKQTAETVSKSAKPSLIPRFTKNRGPAVNVAYINPQVTKWPKESSVSFKIDTSDYDSHQENMTEAKKNQYKREFLKVLESTKTADRFKLWQTIWNQALENRQTKNHTVTIQIPDPNDHLRQKMVHLEYTIGELERLLLSNPDHQESRR